MLIRLSERKVREEKILWRNQSPGPGLNDQADHWLGLFSNWSQVQEGLIYN